MKIFQLDDCTNWYMAPTLDDAIAEAVRLTGMPTNEIVDDPRELTEDEMESLTYRDEDGTERTFAEELNRREPKTQFFASSDC